MRLMILVFFNIALLISSSLMASTPTGENSQNSQNISTEQLKNSPLGFKDWKQKRVFNARAMLDAFKAPKEAEIAKAPENAPKDVENSGDNNELKPNNVQESENKPGNSGKKTEAPVDGDQAKAVAQTEAQVEKVVVKPKVADPAKKAQEEKLRQLEFNLEIAQGLTIHDYFALYLKDKTRDEMALAIQQLSPDEVSELLMAYRSSLYGIPKTQKAAKN